MSKITEASHREIKVLVAEDSPTQALQLKHILQGEGYQVTIAANGRLALEAAQHLMPTLIMSDVVMPEMDGYELSRRIKADPKLCDVPVILVTTMSDPQDVIRGLECGADSFILKPFDERYLLGRMQFVIMNRQMREMEGAGPGVEIIFNGKKHFITANRLQILNLLLPQSREIRSSIAIRRSCRPSTPSSKRRIRSWSHSRIQSRMTFVLRFGPWMDIHVFWRMNKGRVSMVKGDAYLG